ncbi:DUF4149 domain-containing protein [Inhella sp. 4Y17]|uniref:DUF4149 domain-containing protein n=1 Tax=Inhella gelatinilytica TaxID=2795030 RepID=A0A931IXF1_9BURK|nr:DUF4149 domain-containing protein [Inhella gelatinilytica]
MLSVALVAAPTAFATLERPQAGLYVAGLFRAEAWYSLALGVLLIMVEQRLQRAQDERRFRFGLGFVVPVAVLVLTLIGAEVLQPLIQQAKMTGQGSFALLHAASTGVFALKSTLVAYMAWALVPRR